MVFWAIGCHRWLAIAIGNKIKMLIKRKQGVIISKKIFHSVTSHLNQIAVGKRKPIFNIQHNFMLIKNVWCSGDLCGSYFNVILFVVPSIDKSRNG